MNNQLLLAQERKDGKIREPQKPDAIDWIFTAIGFCSIEAIPIGGFIASWIAGNLPGLIICVIFAVGLPYMVMSSEK